MNMHTKSQKRERISLQKSNFGHDVKIELASWIGPDGYAANCMNVSFGNPVFSTHIVMTSDEAREIGNMFLRHAENIAAIEADANEKAAA